MLTPLQQELLRAGLVDLDGSFFVQLGIFALFALIINGLVLKPLGKVQELRFARLAGARAEAERMSAEADEASAQYRERMDAETAEAVAMRDALKEAAEQSARGDISAAREEADRTLTAGREVLAEQEASTRKEMQTSVDDLAEAIAHRLLSKGGGG